MSKFIELSFVGDGNRKTLVNVERVENVFENLEGVVHVTFSKGHVAVIESYEKVKELINK